MIRTPAFFVKTLGLALLLLVETAAYVLSVVNYIQTQNFFAFSIQTLVTLGVLMLIIILTFSLTVGAWDGMLTYTTTALPLGVGVLTAAFYVDYKFVLAAAAVVMLVVANEVYTAAKTGSILIKFDPYIVLRPASKTILTLLSLLAGLMVLLSLLSPTSTFDVARSLPGGVSPQIGGLVADQVFAAIQPYSRFVPYVIALITFSFAQLLGAIVYILYSLAIRKVFSLAKVLRFFNVQEVEIMQERLGF